LRLEVAEARLEVARQRRGREHRADVRSTPRGRGRGDPGRCRPPVRDTSLLEWRRPMDEQVELLRAIWNEMKALNGRVDGTNGRLDETNARLEQTNARLEQTNARLEETTA